MLSWTVTSTFASIFLKYASPVSIIQMISIEFGVTYLYILLQQNNIANIAKRKLFGTCSTRHHYHYFNSYTGLLLLIELFLSCPLLHIVLYLHNNHPTWLVSCIFQISLRNSDHQFHNLLCLKQNSTWTNMLSLSLRLGSEMTSPSL